MSRRITKEVKSLIATVPDHCRLSKKHSKSSAKKCQEEMDNLKISPLQGGWSGETKRKIDNLQIGGKKYDEND